MAATLVQSSGKKRGDGWTASSRTENAASNFTVGNTVIVAMQYYGSAADLTSVVIAGTTATRAIRSPAAWSGGETASIIYYAKIANSGRSDVVINGDTQYKSTLLTIDEWSGLMDSPVDKTSAAGPTTSTSPAAGSSGTLAQADEVVYFNFSQWTVVSSVTDPSGYTLVYAETGSGVIAGNGYYRIVSATTAQNPTATLASSDLWTAALATFKAAASDPVGTLAATLGALTGAAASVLGPPVATLGATLGTLALSAAATLSGAVGSLGSTLGAVALSATMAVGVAGESTPTLAAATLSADGSVGSAPATGDLSSTLGAATASGAGVVSVQAAATPTLSTISLSGSGSLDGAIGSATPTLGTATLSGAAVVPVNATATPSLAAATLSGSGVAGAAGGTLSVTLGTLALSTEAVANYSPAMGQHSSESLEFGSANTGEAETTPAVTTQATGSTFLVGVGRENGLGTPTGELNGSADGNTYTQVGSDAVYDNFTGYNAAMYVKQDGLGGALHRWQQPGVVNFTEGAIVVAEVMTGGHIQQVAMLEDVAAASVITSPSVITTQDAILVSFWWGNGADSSADMRALPSAGSGWTLLESRVDMFGGNGAFQLAMAYKAVSGAGTKTGCPWEGRQGPTLSDNQGGHLWTIAVQKFGGAGLASTLGAATLSGAAAVGVVGTATPTLGAATLSADGTASSGSPIIGTATPTLASLTLSGQGLADVAGASTPTLGTLALSGTATLAGAVGTATPTLGALTTSAEGALATVGTSALTFAAATLSADGTVSSGAPITGTATPTLESLGISSTASLSGPVGTATPTLGSIQTSSSAAVLIQGSASPTLDPLLLSTVGHGRTLDEVTVSLSTFSVPVSLSTFSVEVSE